MLADPDVREMARARNIAHEEIGRITGHEVHDRYIEFENQFGNRWRVAREPQTRTRLDLAVEARRYIEETATPYTFSPQPWITNTLDWWDTPQPEREIVSNDRHSPNRQRRPESISQGRNVSRFGHSRRHRG